jgi:hypothetical protein
MYLASFAGRLAAYIATGLVNRARGVQIEPAKPAFGNLHRGD